MTPALVESFSFSRLNAPTIHQHSSGLTIIAEQIPVEAVNLSLWMGIGSVVEPDSINGMAHFLEHMIFKGTASLASGEFERLIEQRGAITNAATSQDYTHYYITSAPSDFAELAPLQIEVVMNAAIPNDAFERERLVVLEEIRRANDNPRRRTFYHSMELAFETLPYRRPVLGPSDVVENLTPQQMRDFHQTWYQPSSMTAVAVGNLPVEQLIDIVTEGFAQAKPLSNPPASEQIRPFKRPLLNAENPFTSVVRREYVDPRLQQARLIMAWRVPGMNELEQTYAFDILSSVLGYGRTARLVHDLREEKGLVSGISVSNMSYTSQGVFYISAQLPLENVPQVEAAIAAHIRQLRNESVTEAELNRVRTLVANRFVFGNETPGDRAGLYGYYQSVIGDLMPAITYPTRIQAIEPNDLQDAAQRYLNPDAYGVIVMRPA